MIKNNKYYKQSCKSTSDKIFLSTLCLYNILYISFLWGKFLLLNFIPPMRNKKINLISYSLTFSDWLGYITHGILWLEEITCHQFFNFLKIICFYSWAHRQNFHALRVKIQFSSHDFLYLLSDGMHFFREKFSLKQVFPHQW